MKLSLQPSTAADFDEAKLIYGRDKGDLVAAAFGAGWPANPDDLEVCRQRAEMSCQQQKDLLENDPTVRPLKVVDLDNNNEIISIGRWHRYPHGAERHGDLEITGLKNRDDPNTWPGPPLQKELMTTFLDQCLAERLDWMGTGHYWVLTNIVTREPFRRHGAGSLILEWGLREAAKEGVPAYLEAAKAAKSLYEKHGFRELGELVVDFSPMGLPNFTLVKMRADPK